MLQWLTEAERRGASVLVLLLLLGAGHDAWVARRMRAEMEHGPARVHPPESSLPAPSPGEPPAEPMSPAPVRLDLNQAGAPELEALPGIGPVLARRIVETRKQIGRYDTAEDLLRVRGVGPRLLERIRPRIRAAREREAMHSAPRSGDGRADSASAAEHSSR